MSLSTSILITVLGLIVMMCMIRSAIKNIKHIGTEEEQLDEAEAQLEALRKSNEIDNEVDGMSDAAVDKQLHDRYEG
jgi:hypothetical protein